MKTKIIVKKTVEEEIEIETPFYCKSENKSMMVYEEEGEVRCAAVFNIPGQKYWNCSLSRAFDPVEIGGLDECSASEYYDRVDLFLKNFHP